MSNGLFQYLFRRNQVQQEIKLNQPNRAKLRGNVIECYDCQKLGYIAVTSLSDYELPQGWKMAWVGFKPLYICGECSEKRRRFVLERCGK